MKLLSGLLFIIMTNFNTAYADILFLDLNNSSKEIEAAKKAAKQRGEKLIVFPDKPIGFSTDIDQDLNQKLTELKSKNQQSKISAMIISGHDGNGHFTGSNGSMSYSAFTNILGSHPELKESVKSLYLWGCYTATPGSIINNWKPTFKNLDVIIGYDGSAPANDKLAGHNYLTDALVKEKRMTNAKTDKELKSVFNSLAHVKNVHASMCKGDTYLSNKKMASLQKLKEQCNETEADKWGDVFQCYMYGEKPKPPENQDLDCTDIPTNTSNGKLRDMYNYLQDTAHCDDLITTTRGRDREQVIRLIFYKKVLKNYFVSNKECIDEINSSLSASGSTQKIDPQEWPNLKRSEILKKSSDISKEIYNINNPATDQDVNKFTAKSIDSIIQKETARSCISQIGVLNDLVPGFIPFSWVEDNSKEKSSFEEVGKMKKAYERQISSEYADQYLRTKAIEEEASAKIIKDEDIKKLEDLESMIERSNYSDESMKEREAFKTELENKYTPELDKKLNKIKNELPTDIDTRVRNEINKTKSIYGSVLYSSRLEYEAKSRRSNELNAPENNR